MRIFPVACRAAEQRMADLFTGELHPRERLDLEAHADGCARCGAALRDLAMISVALDRAYAPLRQRGTLLSPARVRLAARVEPQATVPWWRAGFVGRLSEATMALAFAALVLGGSLDLAVKTDATPSTPSFATAEAQSVIRDYMRTQPPYEETAYLRWLRFQLSAIGAEPVQTVRYPVGGQYDVAQFSSEDDRLSIDAPH
ncbi:MAG: zf-HC2 domain-containing protein [Candidatus Limnocylindria bacterium]